MNYLEEEGIARSYELAVTFKIINKSIERVIGIQ